VYFKLFNLKDQ